MAGETWSLIHEITELDAETLAEAWCDLNRWRWPSAFDEAHKPYWWDGADGFGSGVEQRKVGFVDVISDYIEARAGGDLIDAEWKRAIA